MAKDYKVALLLDFYGEMLTEKQRDMVDLYYNEDMSLGEIAQNAGISRQGVRDSIKRAEGILYDMEEKLCFIKRHKDLLEKVQMISSELDLVDQDNENYYYSPVIRRHVGNIRQLIEDVLQE